jgi:TniQ
MTMRFSDHPSDIVDRPYESWDLTLPTLSRRSRLYQLEPIGIGTPMVESLSGYLARLAEAHCLSPYLLDLKEVAPLVGRRHDVCYHRGEGDMSSTSVQLVNGAGLVAEKMANALELLTQQAGLRHLTLWPWAAIFRRGGQALQRHTRAWCPQCLREWRECGQTWYEPLLWTIGAVTVCVKHQRSLCQVCPHCGRRNGLLNSRLRPGYCAHCWRPLSDAHDDPITTAGLSLAADKWEFWVASALGDVLTDSARRQHPPDKNEISRTIAGCIAHATDGNDTAFARQFHFTQNTARRWRIGEIVPTFATLLEICYRLNLSVVGFLYGELQDYPITFINPFPHWRYQTLRPRRTGIKPTTDDELRTALLESIEEMPPPSGHQVRQRIRCSRQRIVKLFPNLYQQIVNRYADHKRACHAVLRDETLAQVRRVIIELHREGVALSHRNIRTRLTRPCHAQVQEMSAILEDFRQQLAES